MLSDSQHATSHFLIGQFPASSRPRRACAKSSPWPRLFSPAFVRRCQQLAPFARLFSSRRLRRACAKSNPNYALEARFREPLPFVYPDAGRARHSRPSSLSKAQQNDGEGILALSGHGFNRAVLPSPLASLPLARLFSSRRPRRACAKSSPRPLRISRSAKLDHLVTHTKHTTSHFLTDNFRVPFALTPISKAQRNDEEGILALSGHGFNRAVLPSPLASLPFARFSSSRRPWRACAKSSSWPRLFSPAFVRRCEQLAPFARFSSSRRLRRACAKSSPRPLRISRSAKLDHLVTHTKHTTSHFLIDNFCVPFALTPISKAQPGLTLLLRDRPARGSRFRPCSPLVTRHSPLPFLIGNEMHSREKSSYCKHTTYKFLIGNEFHPRRIRFSGFSLPSPASCASSASQREEMPRNEAPGLPLSPPELLP
jgi:hypothetical protein